VNLSGSREDDFRSGLVPFQTQGGILFEQLAKEEKSLSSSFHFGFHGVGDDRRKRLSGCVHNGVIFRTQGVSCRVSSAWVWLRCRRAQPPQWAAASCPREEGADRIFLNASVGIVNVESDLSVPEQTSGGELSCKGSATVLNTRADRVSVGEGFLWRPRLFRVASLKGRPLAGCGKTLHNEVHDLGHTDVERGRTAGDRDEKS